MAVPERSFQLLPSLPEEARRAVLRRCRRTRYGTGAFVYHAGQKGDALHLITHGRVIAVAGGALGEPVTLAIMGAGEAFGEMALIVEDHTRTATIKTLEPTETLVLRQGDFDELRRREPVVNEVLIQVLVARVHRLTTQVAELVELSPRVRIYRRLLSLGGLFEVAGSDEPIPVSQHQLASLAGVKLRVTSRELGRARSNGLVQTGRGRISVLDWAGLRRAAAVRPGFND